MQQERPFLPQLLPFVSSVVLADTILFTTVLYLAESPLGPLLIGYALLVTASGLFFRVHLVVVTTFACALS